MDLKRLIRHVLLPGREMRRAFPRATLDAIEQGIREAERGHRGEIRFALEGALELPSLLRGQTARARALELFANLRVWDTEHNNGVLIYVLLADRNVEIVADRGIHKHVQQQEWEAVCREMEQAFSVGDFQTGALSGIRMTGALICRHFPAEAENPNELPDRPFVR